MKRLSRDKKGNILTAKQIRLVHEYVIRNTDSKMVAELDHFTSFLIVFWGAAWLAFTSIMNIFSEMNLELFGVILGAINVIVIGIHWSLYKLSQYQNRVELRVIIHTSFFYYIDILFLTLLTTIIIIMTIFIQNAFNLVGFNFILIVFSLVSVFLWTYFRFPGEESRGKDIAEKIVKPVSRIRRLDSKELHETETRIRSVAEFSRCVEGVSYIALLIILNYAISMGLIISALGGSLNIWISFIGNPIWVILILVFTILVIYSGFRSYYSHIRSVYLEIINQEKLDH